jgi:aldose 1-epimerase
VAAAPSGRQHLISQGNQRAVIVEVGGGLRSYDDAAGPMLDGYEEAEVCSGGRGQPLIPWPNRVRDGRYQFAGADQQLALTEPAQQNAIHGLVRWANWDLADRDADRLTMAYTLHPQPGWPGTVELEITYSLHGDGLTVTTTATNVGSSDCPFGAGFHPYLTLGTSTVDSVALKVPGRSYLEADQQGIPVQTLPVAGTDLDFTAPREIEALVLDTGYTDLERDPDGLARVRLADRDDGDGLALWMDHSFSHVMIFTGDTLAPQRRRRGLAVEPMTCAPNALQSGDGLLTLAPGDRFRGGWGIGRTGRT